MSSDPLRSPAIIYKISCSKLKKTTTTFFQEQLKALNESNIRGMVEDILHDVAQAANQLEQDLDDHVFDNAVHDPNLASFIFLIYFLFCKVLK